MVIAWPSAFDPGEPIFITVFFVGALMSHEFYGIVPHTVLFCDDITTTDIAIYAHISARINGNSETWVSNKRLGQDLRIHKDTAGKSVRKLILLGHFKVRYDSKESRRYLSYPTASGPIPIGVETYPPTASAPTPHRREKGPKKEPLRIHKEVYGEFKHVRLTKDEYKSLIELMGDDGFKDMVTRMDEYIEQTGKKYKNHSLAMKNWRKRDRDKNGKKDVRKVINYCTHHPSVILDGSDCYMCEEGKK